MLCPVAQNAAIPSEIFSHGEAAKILQPVPGNEPNAPALPEQGVPPRRSGFFLFPGPGSFQQLHKLCMGSFAERNSPVSVSLLAGKHEAYYAPFGKWNSAKREENLPT
jgi:hypothetical protein